MSVCTRHTAAPADAGAAQYIEQVERRAEITRQELDERMRDIDHGHVRALAHYTAMLAELLAEQ